MADTNPHGANQYQLDPRQKLCWESYNNPKSETFGNAYQSALKSGYEESTSSQITTENWFLEKLRRLNLLSKAEKVLDETLDYNAIDDKGKIDVGVGRLKLDSAKHVTSLRGKEEGYDGETKTIFVLPSELINKNEPTSSTSTNS